MPMTCLHPGIAAIRRLFKNERARTCSKLLSKEIAKVFADVDDTEQGGYRSFHLKDREAHSPMQDDLIAELIQQSQLPRMWLQKGFLPKSVIEKSDHYLGITASKAHILARKWLSSKIDEARAIWLFRCNDKYDARWS